MLILFPILKANLIFDYFGETCKRMIDHILLSKAILLYFSENLKNSAISFSIILILVEFEMVHFNVKTVPKEICTMVRPLRLHTLV